MHEKRKTTGRLAFSAVCLLFICFVSCARQETKLQPATSRETADTGVLSGTSLPATAPNGPAFTREHTGISVAERATTATSTLSGAEARRPAGIASTAAPSPAGSIPATAAVSKQSPTPLIQAEAATIFHAETTAKITAAPAHTSRAEAPEVDRFLTDYETQVVALVNSRRAQESLAPLTVTAPMRDTAHLRVTELTQRYAHTRPDGTSCFTAFPESDAYGENAARGQQTPADVMQSWMGSEAHRQNILNPDFTRIGVGCVREGDTLYWVQCFAGD